MEPRIAASPEGEPIEFTEKKTDPPAVLPVGLEFPTHFSMKPSMIVVAVIVYLPSCSNPRIRFDPLGRSPYT